jgi:hypothetical protein
VFDAVAAGASRADHLVDEEEIHQAVHADAVGFDRDANVGVRAGLGVGQGDGDGREEACEERGELGGAKEVPCEVRWQNRRPDRWAGAAEEA